MLILPISDLYKYSPLYYLENLDFGFKLRFQDNVDVEYNPSEIILIRYLLEILIDFPEISITSKYNVKKYYSNNIYTSKTISSFMEQVIEDVITYYIKNKNISNGRKVILEPLYRKMFILNNIIYNEYLLNKIDYITSMSIEDFIEIQETPRLLKAIKDTEKYLNNKYINITYKVLDDVLRNEAKLKNNLVCRGYISNTINPNQVKQMLGVRGYCTDIDNHIFKYPIATNYVLGLHNIYYMTVESRGAAKALYLQNNAIKQTEYFARELQLTCMPVEKLIDTDCGSQEYLEWYVKKENDKSDLGKLLGKYYLNETTGELEIITKNHTHLENTFIKLRSPLYCKLNNRKHICIKCFGDIGYSIPEYANIGHYCATEVTERSTQLTLSDKHYKASSSTNDVELDEVSSKFFIIHNNNYYFKPEILESYYIKVIITKTEAYGLKDINTCININKLNIGRITRIESLLLILTDKKTKQEEVYTIMVKDGNKYGSFSNQLLNHILKHGYNIHAYDKYSISITDFNPKYPFIIMPDLEYNFVMLVKQIKSLFKTMKNNNNSIEGLLQKVFDMVNNKLEINISILETIVYAFSIIDSENNDFRLSRNSDLKELAKIKTIITNKSLGGAYAWEEVTNTILNPYSFNPEYFIDHPLDALVMPQEVLRDYNPEIFTPLPPKRRIQE